MPPVEHADNHLEGWRPPTSYYLDPTPANLNETPEECAIRHRRAIDRQLADARLMAAAPDLMEACRLAMTLIEQWTNQADDDLKDKLKTVYTHLEQAGEKALHGRIYQETAI
jgi:hypothetical protein